MEHNYTKGLNLKGLSPVHNRSGMKTTYVVKQDYSCNSTIKELYIDRNEFQVFLIQSNRRKDSDCNKNIRTRIYIKSFDHV